MEAATRVNLEIIEEKVPTIEEAKSLEVIVDVSKTGASDSEKKTGEEKPPSDGKKTEEQSTEAKKTDEPVTEVIAKVESEVVESGKPLEELKVSEASAEPDKDDKPMEHLVTVELNIGEPEDGPDKSDDQEQKETPTDASAEDPKPVEPQESKEDEQQKEAETTSDVPPVAADIITEGTDKPKEVAEDKDIDLSQNITLTINTDEQQHPEVTIKIEPTADEEKSSDPAPVVDKQEDASQSGADEQSEGNQPPPESTDVKRPESTHSNASSSSSSSANPSSSHSKHEETPDREEKDPSPPDDGDSSED